MDKETEERFRQLEDKLNDLYDAFNWFIRTQEDDGR